MKKVSNKVKEGLKLINQMQNIRAKNNKISFKKLQWSSKTISVNRHI